MANEQRLIDANALMVAFRIHMVERYDRERCYSEENCKTCGRQCLWYEKVNNAPTVDAVEVKCKVGDYVYALWEAPVKLKHIIYCAEVKEIRISMRNCRLTTSYILEPIDFRGRRREYRDEDFGTLYSKNKRMLKERYILVNTVSAEHTAAVRVVPAEKGKNNERKAD